MAKDGMVVEESLLDSKKTRDDYDVVSNMLRDTGIKSVIIKKYLPIMNQLVNRYLKELDFYVSFDLNENFEETIKSRFRDEFTYASFSEGEKMRIDLALLFTWRTIAKMKNSANTNLLILDEIFDSSLDGQGTDDFLKILHTVSDNTNVFVISHKTESLQDKFASTLQVEKKQNFSVISRKNKYNLQRRSSWRKIIHGTSTSQGAVDGKYIVDGYGLTSTRQYQHQAERLVT